MPDVTRILADVTTVQHSRPCASLAVAVIEQAIRDFAPPSHVVFGGPDRNFAITDEESAWRVSVAIEAGEFLLTREDAIVEHWCEALGIALVDWRQRAAALEEWHAHLAQLRTRLRAHRSAHGRQGLLF